MVKEGEEKEFKFDLNLFVAFTLGNVFHLYFIVKLSVILL